MLFLTERTGLGIFTIEHILLSTYVSLFCKYSHCRQLSHLLKIRNVFIFGLVTIMIHGDIDSLPYCAYFEAFFYNHIIIWYLTSYRLQMMVITGCFRLEIWLTAQGYGKGMDLYGRKKKLLLPNREENLFLSLKSIAYACLT